MNLSDSTRRGSQEQAKRARIVGPEHGPDSLFLNAASHRKSIQTRNETPAREPAEIKKILRDAKDLIQEEKERFEHSDHLHLSSAAEMLDKTLCLASPFNRGEGANSVLSIFAEDSARAGHYSRSFEHDLLRSDNDKPDVLRMICKEEEIPEGQAAKEGLPLKKDKPDSLNEEQHQNHEPPKSTDAAPLYDASLKYQVNMAKYISNNVGDLKHIKVDAFNNYPAIMVSFDAQKFADIPKEECSDKAREDFNQFLMSHFAGIVNAEAAKAGITTPMVEHSVFGHATPSFTVTVDGFHLNLGMMPAEYAEVHIKALKTLDRELSAFKTGISDTPGIDLADYGQLEQSPQKEELEEAANIMQLAFKKAEQSNAGKTLITNTMRTMQSRNFVDACSFEQHIDSATPSDPIGESLGKLFDSVQYKTNIVQNKPQLAMSIVVQAKTYDMSKHTPKGTKAATLTRSESDMGIDREAFSRLQGSHKSYLDDFSTKFGDLANSQKGFNAHRPMMEVRRTLHSQNLNIASSLDIANQLMTLHTLEKIENGAVNKRGVDVAYGSDSDIKDGNIHGKKIITHNGMRALVTAVNAHGMLYSGQDKELSIAYENPYGEAEDDIGNLSFKPATGNGAIATAGVIYINACITDGKSFETEGKPIAERFPNAKVWIIDSTDATTTRMSEIYGEFKNSNRAELLFFASSDLKNEQGMADANNYGTVRVFAKSVSPDGGKGPEVGEIIGGIESPDKGQAMFSHEYRRTMKQMRYVPTNSSIVMKDSALFMQE